MDFNLKFIVNQAIYALILKWVACSLRVCEVTMNIEFTSYISGINIEMFP